MRMRRVVVIALTAVALVIGGSAVAQAGSYSSSYANLSRMPTLGSGYVTKGNVVGFWQSVLYADGHGNKCTSNSPNGIDGYFGSRTKGGTTTWQNRFMGSGAGDGLVGPKTWSRVFASTVYMGWYEYGNAHEYRYVGLRDNVWYLRNYDDSFLPENLWGFRSPSNPATSFQPFYWPTITFYTC